MGEQTVYRPTVCRLFTSAMTSLLRPIIRRAVLDDVDAVAHIFAVSFAELFRAEFGLRQAEVTTLLADLYRHGVLPLDKVWVADQGDMVVGAAVLSLPNAERQGASHYRLSRSWQVFRKRRGWKGALRAAIGSSLMRYYFSGRTPRAGEAYVDSVAVEESARGQGIGRALIEACCETALERGCCEIALHVSNAKPEARRLYESCGFRASVERRIIARVVDSITAGVERLSNREAAKQRSTLMVKPL